MLLISGLQIEHPTLSGACGPIGVTAALHDRRCVGGTAPGANLDEVRRPLPRRLTRSRRLSRGPLAKQADRHGTIGDRTPSASEPLHQSEVR
jgi:hypothetical protein